MDTMPRLGQGTWRMGETPARWADERDALRAGIDAGVRLIDTAEMYGDGSAETLVGEAIRGIPRHTLYIVSKVYPQNAGGRRLSEHCDATLRRLGIETLDLYLLHWRGRIPLEETVAGMEDLISAGKIRRWGVSNFDVGDMEQLLRVPGGDACATDQVLYHLGSRGIEHSLIPWLKARSIPVMAYCPLAQAGRLRQGLLQSDAVRDVAARNALSPAQVLLGFVLAQDGMIAIPKAASRAHALENARMAKTPLSPEDIALLSKAFPAPDRKVPLDIE